MRCGSLAWSGAGTRVGASWTMRIQRRHRGGARHIYRHMSLHNPPKTVAKGKMANFAILPFFFVLKIERARTLSC